MEQSWQTRRRPTLFGWSASRFKFPSRHYNCIDMGPPALKYARTSDGVNIAYLALGEGPTLVFASNIFGEAQGYELPWPHYREVTDMLVRRGYRVVRYDVRGMGYSDRDVSDTSLAARIKDLEAVIQALELRQFDLAGLDLGAATALAFAAEHPGRVSRLIAISPWVSGQRMFDLTDLRMVSATEPNAEREWELFSKLIGTSVTSFVDKELGELTATMIRRSTTPRGLFAYYDASREIELSSMLGRIKAPTLVIHETEFPFGSRELCQQVAAMIPNARFVVVKGPSIAGRMHDEHVDVIDSFLKEGALTPSPREPAHTLTAREAQVLAHVAAGLSNKEIAAKLSLSVSTIERHLVNIYTKIGARGRADATAFALRNGLAEV